MKVLINLLNWIFSSKYRKEKRGNQLKFIRMQIKTIRSELIERDELVSRVHENALDKDSTDEQGRHQAKMDDINHNKSLLEHYLRHEKLLKKRLPIA